MAPSPLLPLLSAFAVVSPCVAQIDPAHALNLTAYHLNPASVGAVPINMDTGDAIGDLYFYLQQFLLPVECASGSNVGRAKFDCDNPERVDPNLVVTKVDFQIDARFTSYSACNLCNGTDPFSGKPCQKGSYSCGCLARRTGGKCDPTRVGVEDVKATFAPHSAAPQCVAAMMELCGAAQNISSKACWGCLIAHEKELQNASCGLYDSSSFCPTPWNPRCNATTPDWVCWSENIPRKYGGKWYSTMKEGLCNRTSSTGSCGWKVYSTRTIKNDCLSERLVSHVESRDPQCFGGCGARNTTSPCWIGCFFDTLLGPEARNSSEVQLGGFPAAELAKVWDDSFLPEEHEGCPNVEVPRTWEEYLVQREVVV
jgi:hypothetical protein